MQRSLNPLDDIDGHVLDALRPRGLKEYLRGALARGWTASQVHARLPADVRVALEVAERLPVDRIHEILRALAARGRVKVRQVRYTVVLNTKGHRDMIVDVFWLP